MKRLLGLLLALSALAAAQVRTIGTGTSISVRTNETIDAKKSDGRVFTGRCGSGRNGCQRQPWRSPKGRTPS